MLVYERLVVDFVGKGFYSKLPMFLHLENIIMPAFTIN